MKASSQSESSAVLTAIGAAGVVTAQFVGGKAARDAMFLASLDVTSLPAMVIATSLFSILLVVVNAKGVSRLVSRRVGLWPLAMLGLAGLGAIVVAVVLSPGVHHLIELIVLRIRDWLGLG